MEEIMSEAFVRNNTPTAHLKKANKLTLDEFMKSAGGKEINEVFSRVRTGSFSACHCLFFEATGIWIPELVPVFQKLDAMAVMGDALKPHGV
jgi:hypothetical protein